MEQSYLRRLVGLCRESAELTTDVERSARLCLLDTLGCILYSTTLADGAMIMRGASMFGTGDYPLPASKNRYTPDTLALVMGSLCHLREMDDVHYSIVHPGSGIIPAAYAAAIMKNAGLGALLSAITAGYEAAVRISRASNFLEHRRRGFHATATICPFGAAMAAAFILDLDEARTVQALGIAGTRTGGTWAFARDNAMTKRLHPGLAARDGLQAACFALAGVSGPEFILDAREGGFFRVFTGDCDMEALLAPAKPAISETEYKYYASCKSAHSPIEAAIQIYKDNMGKKPAKIEVKINSSAMSMAGRLHEKGSVVSAQLSIPYAVALGLSGHTGGALDYTDDMVSDDALFGLAALVEMAISPEMDQIRAEKHRSAARLKVYWEDGGSSGAFVQTPRGAMDNPLSEEEIIHKFLTLSSSAVGHSVARELVSTIMEGPHYIRIRELVDMIGFD
ncbi:MAG: MmgE/PrpD family protein [Oscillospiraceae bacterium]|nr:MmgE/PrpD family protein [Oscillospiraceae bacterium]